MTTQLLYNEEFTKGGQSSSAEGFCGTNNVYKEPKGQIISQKLYNEQCNYRILTVESGYSKVHYFVPAGYNTAPPGTARPGCTLMSTCTPRSSPAPPPTHTTGAHYSAPHFHLPAHLHDEICASTHKDSDIHLRFLLIIPFESTYHETNHRTFFCFVFLDQLRTRQNSILIYLASFCQINVFIKFGFEKLEVPS